MNPSEPFDEPAFREAARQLAESCSATLKDSDRGEMAKQVRLVSEGLTSITESPELAARVAMAFSRLLSMFARMPLSIAGDVLNDSMTAYSIAAGHLLGVYKLPDPPEGEEEDKVAVSEVVQPPTPFEWHGDKRYL